MLSVLKEVGGRLEREIKGRASQTGWGKEEAALCQEEGRGTIQVRKGGACGAQPAPYLYQFGGLRSFSVEGMMEKRGESDLVERTFTVMLILQHQVTNQILLHNITKPILSEGRNIAFMALLPLFVLQTPWKIAIQRGGVSVFVENRTLCQADALSLRHSLPPAYLSL